MRERPIIFSGPMVRAILAGTKTQTRRIISPRHLKFFDQSAADMLGRWDKRPLPYGGVGDRLWVRETLAASPGLLTYAADDKLILDSDALSDELDNPDPQSLCEHDRRAWELIDRHGENDFEEEKRVSARYMPRVLSRLLLEITDVRVQRLGDISDADVIAEGCKVCPKSGTKPGYVFDGTEYDRAGLCHSHARVAFEILWDQINGPGSWDANPWVWAITFRKLENANA